MDQFVSHQVSKAEIARLREDYNLVRYDLIKVLRVKTCLSVNTNESNIFSLQRIILSVQIDNEGSANMSSIYAAKFQLGHALVHSLERSDIPSGIQILEELVKKHHDSDARRDYSKYGNIVGDVMKQFRKWSNGIDVTVTFFSIGIDVTVTFF